MADAPAPVPAPAEAAEHQRQQQQQPAPTAARAPHRENISIAFSRSQYATPSSDHTIPGSKPGHRMLRMGRQHQPPDALYNHLSHGLVAPGGCVTTAATNGGYFHHNCPEPWNGTADHPSPPGGNYVLHTKNGGKRHYDEPSGFCSEPTWQPSKRLVGPVPEEERRHLPHRRGRGVYNLSDRWIHPDAADALARREEAVQRVQAHGGKAKVAGPPDHTLEELSLWVRTPGMASSGAAAPADDAKPAVAIKTGERKRLLRPHHAGQNSINAAHAPLTHPPPPVVLEEFNDDVILPAIGYGVPPPRCTAAEADAVAQYHREKRVRHILATQRAATSASGTRAADMQAVRELPNW